MYLESSCGLGPARGQMALTLYADIARQRERLTVVVGREDTAAGRFVPGRRPCSETVTNGRPRAARCADGSRGRPGRDGAGPAARCWSGRVPIGGIGLLDDRTAGLLH